MKASAVVSQILNEQFELFESLYPLAVTVFFLSMFGFNLWFKTINMTRRRNLVVVGFCVLGVLFGIYLVFNVPSEKMNLGRHCTAYAGKWNDQKAKVKIITFADGKSSFLGDQSSSVNKAYAEKFGFIFKRYYRCGPKKVRGHVSCSTYAERVFLKRALQWTKIPLLHEEMTAHNAPEWVMFIDADAVFVNFDYNLYDDFLRHLDKIHVLVAQDLDAGWRPINTGVMIMRVGKFSKELLERIWNTGPSLHLRWNWFHEQGTLTYLVEKDKKVRDAVMVLTGEIPGVGMYDESECYCFKGFVALDINFFLAKRKP